LVTNDEIFSIDLAEWTKASSTTHPRLKYASLKENVIAQQLAQKLRRRLRIYEGFHGLEVESTSFVGCINVGPLRISVRPKLPALPLIQLFRYAYRLSDLSLFDISQAPLAPSQFQDLLILMLANETERLSRGGLMRQYQSIVEDLASPRGSPLIHEVIRRGGMLKATLPCRYYERRLDWTLNQVLRAGLQLAAYKAIDRDLRRRIHGLSDRLHGVECKSNLQLTDLDQAERSLTRLTSTYQPALAIIRLLLQGFGPEVEGPNDRQAVPGFLFDMNAFFQRLLSRFLRDHLAGYEICDEHQIRRLFMYAPQGNPRKRRSPRPRPDFALYQNHSLRCFLDAKYRDIWNQGYLSSWLYQLSIYALASPTRTSVILYASSSDAARDERIEIRNPSRGSSDQPSTVIMRPVPLQHLSELVSAETRDAAVGRQRLANHFVRLTS
jgi:5-methylcytosine-specific restriction enzyme subunit McrC